MELQEYNTRLEEGQQVEVTIEQIVEDEKFHKFYCYAKDATGKGYKFQNKFGDYKNPSQASVGETLNIIGKVFTNKFTHRTTAYNAINK
jgi:hypothetical protein